jgi:AcrR family transcriptional regulator
MSPRRYNLGKRAQSVEETRRRIVDATFQLHNEKGVIGTSMQDIADRADVSLHTVYSHFPTVDALVGGCANKVIALLSPPGPDIFRGLDAIEPRLGKLTRELFAMYERGAFQIETARCEASEVAALAGFVAGDAMSREALVREALRPLRVPLRRMRSVTALTDFYVWKAFNLQAVSTHRAAEVVTAALVALISPSQTGEGRRTK